MVFAPQFGRLIRRAIAAGGGTPVDDERPHVEATPSPFVIPEDWEALSWPHLRSLASTISRVPILNKAQAVAAIRGELKSRHR